jgi:hypothetical protein
MVNLWQLGTFCDHLVHFVPLWYVAPKKICLTNRALRTVLKHRSDFWSGYLVVYIHQLSIRQPSKVKIESCL